MKKRLVIAVIITAMHLPVFGASTFTRAASPRDVQDASYDFDLYLIRQKLSKPDLTAHDAFNLLPANDKRGYVFGWLAQFIGDPRPEKGILDKPENKMRFRAAYEMLKNYSKPTRLNDTNYEEAMAPIDEAIIYIGMYNPEIRKIFEKITNNWVEKALAKKTSKRKPAKKLARKPAPKKRLPAKKEKRLMPRAKEKRIVIREAAKAYAAGIRIPPPGARPKAKIKKAAPKKPIRAKVKPAPKRKVVAKKRVAPKRDAKAKRAKQINKMKKKR